VFFVVTKIREFFKEVPKVYKSEKKTRRSKMCILKRKPERKDVCYKPIMKTEPTKIRKKRSKTKATRLSVFALNIPII
jgi:hypothetical protein